MFQYLFRLKRLQLELEEAWAALKGGRESPPVVGSGSAPLWHVRAHMAHYINNLLIYIQVNDALLLCATLWLEYAKMLKAGCTTRR